MLRRTRTLTVIAALVMGASAAPALGGGLLSPRAAQVNGPPDVAGSTARSRRPDQADWQKIKAAAQLRDLGMAPHRTAHFRVFAGTLGLSELATIQPLAPGRCLTALTYLYGNLLDLQNAERGESFAPLRRFVAREPSIRACAPRATIRPAR